MQKDLWNTRTVHMLPQGKELIEDFATPEKREAILSFLDKNGGREGTNWWNAINRKPSEAINQTYNLFRRYEPNSDTALVSAI